MCWAASNRQVVEVVWVAAIVTYLNLLARPLRLQSDGLCALVEAKRGTPLRAA
jgi:hypothetical protein